MNDVPAFARTGIGNAGTMYDVPAQDGMSLYEYVAIEMLKAILMHEGPVHFDRPDSQQTFEEDLDRAFKYAEGFMARRDKKQ